MYFVIEQSFSIVFVQSKPIRYTQARKYWTGKQKFGDLCPITQEPVVVQKRYIPHLKALILSFYEPEGQGLWFPNKASTPT